ncbi:DNA-3-methyladenine glycosylase 1 [Bienertia sinuspersici]
MEAGWEWVVECEGHLVSCFVSCDDGIVCTVAYLNPCRWPRTLSMAKALCDLQLELQSQSSVNALGDAKSEVAANGRERFTPGTPAIKESQRKRKMQKVESGETVDAVNVTNADESSKINSAPLVNGIRDDEVDELNENSGEITTFGLSISDDKDEELNENSVVVSELRMMCSTEKMGNFPSPIEIASLDEIYLVKRCGLGYRSGRILKLAQGVVDGRIQLDQLEELCNEACLSNYNKVDEKLREIEGFGPFTRGNVMMCLGFYNVVPTDSETIRHLKQVHGTTTTIQKVQKVVEEMYKKYEPYQFLAYWWEIWSFYEGHFGKFSEMPSSDYKLITASNMRTKKTKKKPA